MAAILLVAGGWAVAAKRAAHYRLAYTLASAAVGAVGHLALVVPMAFILNKGIWEIWFHPAAVLMMTASTILTAAILRRSILAPGPWSPLGAAFGNMYLASILFPCVWGVGFLAVEPRAGLAIILLGSIGGPVLATLTIPITLPLSLACCWILRYVDPWRSRNGRPVTAISRDATYTQGIDTVEASDDPKRAETAANQER
jgi:hypothetical protein